MREPRRRADLTYGSHPFWIFSFFFFNIIESGIIIFVHNSISHSRLSCTCLYSLIRLRGGRVEAELVCILVFEASRRWFRVGRRSNSSYAVLLFPGSNRNRMGVFSDYIRVKLKGKRHVRLYILFLLNVWRRWWPEYRLCKKRVNNRQGMPSIGKLFKECYWGMRVFECFVCVETNWSCTRKSSKNKGGFDTRSL